MKLMLNGKEVTGMGHYVMAGDIKDATAEDSNVLSGKSYYNNNGKREGTMPNRGGMSAELAAGGSVSIPEGYHNGEGVVRAQDLASQTAGTAAAANIEAGYTAWVNGVEVEGVLEGTTILENVTLANDYWMDITPIPAEATHLEIADQRGNVSYVYKPENLNTQTQVPAMIYDSDMSLKCNVMGDKTSVRIILYRGSSNLTSGKLSGYLKRVRWVKMK